MRNPGTDFHRREVDALHSEALSRQKEQARLNAAEWRKRNQVRQALLVDPSTSFKLRADIQDQITAEIVAKVVAPEQAPAYEDGAR